ncbi:addiction module toxin RelE [Citrobacter braakii]|nr:addiction module toxin RelE [Citrobacter freundii complex sp. CFNIH3]AVJ52956.1 addiction module toxin RelE [Citrobacter braakii]POV64457.1 addiction module toxin RelE [Citrobacter freundii complex sp. CFNIH5]POT33109.1 addiction module toxin RelE [Citrobacter braakii]POT37938.1 addiction module toxin RelE [Citrobacter braakii]
MNTARYTTTFLKHRGGKNASHQALTKLSDRCEWAKPTKRQ